MCILRAPHYVDRRSFKNHCPKYVAHKALVSNKHHGNTLEAIKETLKSSVDGMELDVRLSKDHVPFIFHGVFLEEETSKKGRAEQLTWDQLKTITYTDSKSKIISLEDVFKIVGSKKYLMLDIKDDRYFNRVFAKVLSRLIRQYKLEKTVVVESFNPLLLILMKWIDSTIIVGYDFVTKDRAIGEETQNQFDNMSWFMKQPFMQKLYCRIIRPDVLGPRWNIEESYMKSLIDRGHPIVAWTVDDKKVAKKLFDMGVKGLCTNVPLKLMNK